MHLKTKLHVVNTVSALQRENLRLQGHSVSFVFFPAVIGLLVLSVSSLTPKPSLTNTFIMNWCFYYHIISFVLVPMFQHIRDLKCGFHALYFPQPLPVWQPFGCVPFGTRAGCIYLMPGQGRISQRENNTKHLCAAYNQHKRWYEHCVPVAKPNINTTLNLTCLRW